jgi:spore germination cell wall hydrolase CwlJ-like protein
MNGRTIPIAMAVLLAAGLPGAAWAPPPTPEAADQLAASAPKPAEPARRGPAKATAADFECLALNVYWESRGQPLDGQAAVAFVTLNRVAAPGFPDTICGVVRQKVNAGCQFGWTCDGRDHRPADGPGWTEARLVALRVLSGAVDPTGGALYFHGVNERPQWAVGKYAHKVQIGGHIFFKVGERPAQTVRQ